MPIRKVEDLAAQILRHRNLYYNHQPEISDAAYDLLIDELKKLQPNHPAIINIGHPVDNNSEWKQAEHAIPLGSLDKVNTPDELKAWINDTFKANNSIFITEKLDGLSIELIYEDGNLKQAITRGNGLIGYDITRNASRMSGVKTKLPISFSGSLRGEIILKRSDKEKYFPELSNPRNGASGIAKTLDGKGCEHLNILFYQAISENEEFQSEFLQFRFIEDTLGLKTPPYDAYVGNSLNDLASYVIKKWQAYHKLRENMDWDIDGLVIRVNDLNDQSALGEKDLRPKGAIAFKFKDEVVKTTILSIISQTGNSGRITPVAEFETVQLAGANVSRSSLYNFSYIKELGIDIGAEVLVRRANEVIPRVEEVIGGKGTGSYFKPPRTCPACGGPTEMRGENLMCVSTDICQNQASGRIKNWINSINILEWGETLIDRLVESGKVKNISDLYKLSLQDLSSIERMGDKSAKKCYDILWSHNCLALDLFLGSLSVPMVGTTTIKLVMDAGFDTLDKILSASKNDFESIKGLGPIKSKSLFDGLARNRKLICEILSAGIKIKEQISGSLKGKTFCITGSTKIKRSDLKKIIVENGGSFKDNMGAGVNFLIIADPNSTSSKANAARKNNTSLLSEEQLLAMIGNQ